MSRQRDELWSHARRVCRLNAQQVETAKKLGMNPKKLPSLNPSRGQSWKLPVGEFIEERYAKRFKNEPRARDAATAAVARGESPSVTDVSSFEEEPAPRASTASEAEERLSDLASDVVCHLANVHDDLEAELASGRVKPETLARVAKDPRRVADEIGAGDSVSQMPYDDFDGEIPF